METVRSAFALLEFPAYGALPAMHSSITYGAFHLANRSKGIRQPEQHTGVAGTCARARDVKRRVTKLLPRSLCGIFRTLALSARSDSAPLWSVLVCGSVSVFRMMMNEEAQRMFMAKIKGSPLPATRGNHRASEKLAVKNNSVNLTPLFLLTTVVIDTLATRESIEENPHGKRQ